jgi:hypothetical protein
MQELNMNTPKICKSCYYASPQLECACGDSIMYLETVSEDYSCVFFKEQTSTL